MDILDDLLRLTRRLQLARGHELQPVRWRPATDIYRTKEGWLLKMELAGVRSEDIEVTVGGRLLCVRGRRCDAELVQGEIYSLEIAYSQFERSVELPTTLDEARVTIEYRNGMLLVHIATRGPTP
jgi:HSP20 family protein